MKKIHLNKEFDKFWKKLKNGENFTLLRYGDGERAIMCGEKVKAQEGWESPEYISELGKALLSTLNIKDKNFFYGISCPCCDNKAYYWYLSRIQSENITFANLWVNANYKKFIKKFDNLKRDAILIANYNAKGHKIGNLNILKHYEIGDDCISFWENQAPQMIQQIKDEYGNKNDLLYVVSAGPMSEPIITELYKNNPNNCYIDFGSSIDKYIHEKQTRPYMDKTTIYAKQNCWMYDPYTTNLDVSVVLTLYKRPEYLEQQLEAIENQSLKPKEILLYQDGTGDTVKIPEHLKERFNYIEISPENKGVWERFNFARKNAKSKYVCIFDDDTIPGSRWLENCMTEMLEQKGLYGAIGVISIDEKYDSNHTVRIGWDTNNEKTMRVDFAGHSWFLQKDWLDYLFEDTEELQKYKICAEDMTLSMKLQQHGIDTYIPKQPACDKELLGSLKGSEFGDDSKSLFINNGWSKMSEAFEKLINEYRFKTIQKLDKKYYKNFVLPNTKPFKLFYKEKLGNKRILHIAGIKISYKKVKKICYRSFLKYKLLSNIRINKFIKFPNSANVDVSIIIPVYNQYKYTLKCLNSIYKNTKGISYEVIIVDDCSTDKTKEIPQNIEKIKYMRNEQNQGFVKSCNIGASLAKGKYLYFINNDTFILKGCIENLLETYKQVPDTGIIGSKIINPITGLVQSAGAYIDIEGNSEPIGFELNPLNKSVNKIKEVMYVCGASLMIKKSLWDKLDGFDEIYSPGYYEESDLCMRCKQAGYKVIYQPKSEILHYGNISFSKREDIGQYIKKNREIFIARYKNYFESNKNP